MDEARRALEQAVPGTAVTIEANRATAGRTQLRLGEDALWYLFLMQFNDWTLTAPPATTPDTLLQA
jgi:hypothetical protein